MTTAYIGLGANLGDAPATLRSAASALARAGRVSAASRLYETEPVGLRDQPRFTNAVCRLETELSADALLAELQAIEAEFGRVRTVRFGPRTLDLDLIAYDDERSHDERLTLPHPRAREREFVLRPLADIAPGLELDGRPVRDWLDDLPPQGVRPTGEPLL
jgi:2-amino-4-hydroxy-6-hydroxymethyldihydropteridine diphosphokinase